MAVGVGRLVALQQQRHSGGRTDGETDIVVGCAAVLQRFRVPQWDASVCRISIEHCTSGVLVTVSLCACSTPTFPFCMIWLAVFVLGLSFILPPMLACGTARRKR